MLGSFLAKKLFARDNSTSRKLKSRHKALARLKSRKATFESLEDRRVLAGFVPGSIQGQEGWSGGTIAINPSVDQAVDQTGLNANSGVGSWHISNQAYNGNFSGWPFGPGLTASAGQPSSGAPADLFTATYYFKSKNTVADGSNIEMDLGTVAGDDRNTFLAVTNDTDGDGGLKLRMSEPDGVTGGFFATQIVATGLTRNAWHRIDITAKFYNGDGNDTFEAKLDGVSLINPNPASPNFNTPLFGTFEGFRNGIASPYALSNRLFFRSGAAASGFDGSFSDAGAQGFYFDDMTYSAATQASPSTPLAVYAAGFEAQPSIVYVDDSWVGTIPGTDPDGGGPATSFGFDSFATINGGVTAVANGGVVQVYAGTYPENVVLNKQLTMLGARAGVDARGRVVGVPNPAVESVVNPPAGRALELQDLADNTTVDGFAFVGFGPNGVIENTVGPNTNLRLLNNYVATAAGSATTPLFLNKSAVDALIDRNVFLASATSTQSVLLDGPDSFHGIHFTNNNVVRSSGVSGTGLFVDGNHNVSNIGSVGTPLFKGNLFQGFATGVNIGSRSFDNGEISENTFTGNTSNGLQGGPQHTQVLRNTFDNTGVGIALTSFGNLAVDRGAQLSTISENAFLNNATADVIFSATQAPGTISSNTLVNNSLGSAIGVSYAGAEIIRASGNWWGTSSNPEIAGKIGGAGAANVDYSPWLNSGADTNLVTPGFQGNFSVLNVDDDSPISAQNGGVARIQEGINVVTVGGTVNVLAGTYNEFVQVNKTVALMGAQAGVDARTRVVPIGQESVVSNGDGDFQILADNVTIDGFTLTGVTNNPSSPPFTGLGAAIWTNPGFSGTQGGHQLRNNIIQGNIVGIELANTGVFQTVVEKNLIQNNNSPGPGSGDGIRGDFSLDNALVDNNTFINQTERGILIFGVSNSTFSNNSFDGRGIGVGGGSNLTFTTNTMNGGGATGISLTSVTGTVDISGNNISGKTTTGIRVLGSGAGVVTLTNNTATGNATAIDIEDYTTVNLTNNATSGNTSGGTLLNITNVNLTGTNSPDTINVDGNASTISTGVMQSVSYSNVTNLNAFGLAGNDTFNVKPATATIISIDGGAPTAVPVGDVLNYDALGLSTSFTPTTISSSGRTTLNYTDIENLNITAAPITVSGTAGDDNLTLSWVDATHIQYVLNGGPPVVLTSPSSFTFDGLAGDDAMLVDFTGGNPVPAGGVFYNGGTQNGVIHNPAGDILRTKLAGNNATYAAGATTGDGTVTVGGRVITFTGLEPVDMFGGGTVTVTGIPVTGTNDIWSVANGFDSNTGLIPALVVTGTSGGTPIESVHLWNNATVVLDTTTVAGTDNITVASGNNAHNNTNLTIMTGAEAGDIVNFNGVLTLAGTLSVDTSAGTANVNAAINAATITGNLPLVNVDDAPSGQIQDGVDLTAVGATVHVVAGTYTEVVTIGKRLTLDGDGSGTNPAVDTIVDGSTLGNLGAGLINLATGGVNAGTRMTVKDLRVTGALAAVPGGNPGTGIQITGGTGFTTFDNVAAVGNAGNGIAINAAASFQDIVVTGSNLSSNVGTGLRIPTSASLDGLTFSGSTVNNNGVNGVSVNPSISDTPVYNNLNFSNSSFTGNGSGTLAGDGDISIAGFNGNASFTNISVTQDGNIGLQLRGKSVLAPAGTITLTNVTLGGTPVNAGATIGRSMNLQRYTSLAGVTFSNVDFTSTGATGLIFDTISGPFSLTDTSFASGNVADIRMFGGTATLLVDATGSTFQVGVPFVNGATATNAEMYAVEDRIFHVIDYPAVGFVRVKAGHVFVTPNSFLAPATTTPDVQRAVNVALAGETVHVNSGLYPNPVSVNKNLIIDGEVDGSGDPNSIISPVAGAAMTIVSPVTTMTLSDLSLVAPAGGAALLANLGSAGTVLNLTNLNSSGAAGGSVSNWTTINFATNNNANTVYVTGVASSGLSTSPLAGKAAQKVEVNGKLIPLGWATTANGTLNVDVLGGDDTVSASPSTNSFINLDGNVHVAGDTLNLDMSGTTPIVIVDGAGGNADSASTKTLHFTRFENLFVYDPVLTNTSLNDFYMRGTSGADYIQFTSAAEVNPKFRVRVGNVYYPTNGGMYGPYTTSGPGASKLFVYGGDGNDTITMYNTRVDAAFFGEGGDDVITGGYGNDLLVGGQGADRINGGSVGGNDEIWGDDFNPALDNPSVASQTLSGGLDQINTYGGNDTVYGQAGNDIINTGDGADYINGGAGNDQIDGQAGNDRIYGGADNDNITGSEGNDIVAGNDGNDTLYGRTGNDILIGGLGVDIVNGNEGSDALVGDESNGAGSKSFSKGDAADAALLALMALWGPTPTLLSLGGFNSSGPDGSTDTLWGGAAADAFFGAPPDNAADRNAPGYGPDLN